MEKENTSQMDSQSFWKWLGILGVAVIVYLLSAGPAVYLRERGVLSKQMVKTIYTPLIGIDDDRFEGYLGWWIKKGREKNP